MPYARKYSTTAKSRRARGAPSSRYRKKVYRKSAARFAGTRTPRRQFAKRTMVRALNNIAETKYISAKKSELFPLAFANNLENYKIHYNLGETVLPGQITNLPTGNILSQFSLGSNTIDGEYAYLRQNSQTFQIRMLSLNDSSYDASALTPVQFRVLIVAPRSRIRSNFNPPPQNLFIDEAGTSFGYDSNALVDNLSVRASLVNKRAWVVLKDSQFTLSPPSFLTGTAAPPAVAGDIGFSAGSINMSKPTFKLIRHKTLVNKKCFYGPGAVSHSPSNYMDDTYIIILATTITGERASNWKVDMQSTTTYTDM